MSGRDKRRFRLPSIRELFPELEGNTSSRSTTHFQGNTSQDSQGGARTAPISDNEPMNTAPVHQSSNFYRSGYDYTSHPRRPASHISHDDGALIRRSRDSRNTSGASRVSDGHRSSDTGTQQIHHNLVDVTYPNERPSSPRSSHQDKRYLCSVCHRAFSRPSAVEAHMPTHTGERPYPCTYEGCTKSFTTKSNMRRHCQSHTAPVTVAYPHRLLIPPTEVITQLDDQNKWHASHPR